MPRERAMALLFQQPCLGIGILDLHLVSLTNRLDCSIRVRQSAVGQAPSLFFSTRALVEFAQQYFSRTL